MDDISAPANLDSLESIGKRFDALTQWLETYWPFVRERPFAKLTLSWEAIDKELSRACRALDWPSIRRMESSPSAWESAPEAYRRLLHESIVQSRVDSIRARVQPVPRPRHIPERKWQQVLHLRKALQPHMQMGARIIDWCGGKGHLGRTLGVQLNSPVVVLERQAHLCKAAERLAQHTHVDLSARVVDVLSTPIQLKHEDHLVGLHACGQLTDRLLHVAHRNNIRFAAVASCCYHATKNGTFYPQSRMAQHTAVLPIDRHTLRLTTADEVIARPTIRRRREREHAFRLGLDLLLREASGIDEYQPIPSVPGALVDGSFESFCHTLAQLHDLKLPVNLPIARAERAGWERSKHARGLGLVRGLFRRPLELWLVLDRALAALDAERQVQVFAFCDRHVTPRNLLLLSTV